MTLDPRGAYPKSPRGTENTGDLVGNLTDLMAEAKRLRSNQDLEGAVKLLEAGVVDGWAAFTSGNRDVGTASVVADCFGMLGGCLIKQKSIGRALAVYRVGRNIEMDVPGVTMTYNTVNLLVTGLLDSGWESLRHAERDIKEVIARLESRGSGADRENVWAWADLGMCEFLRRGFHAAEDAYRHAAKLGDDDSRHSMRDKLFEIRDRWPQDDGDRKTFYENIRGILA